jgi:Tol biopolymer transport system component
MRTSKIDTTLLLATFWLISVTSFTPAQDAAIEPERPKTTTGADVAPSNGDEPIPDICGTWEMASEGSPGFCEIRHIADSRDYVVYYKNKNNPFRVEWDQKSRSYLGTRGEIAGEKFRGTSRYMLSLEDSGQALRIRIQMDEEGIQSFRPTETDLLKNGWTQEQVDGLFNIKMTRTKLSQHDSMADNQINASEKTESTSPAPPIPDRIESDDILLIESKQGLSAFSKSLGRWDRVSVELPNTGASRIENSTVSSNFASVIINDQLLGFSSRSGRWDSLTIPSEFQGKVKPVHGVNFLSVKIGDQIYAFSSKSGKWTSSEEASSNEAVRPDDKGDSIQKLNIGFETPESKQLTQEYLKYELHAASLAEQIRGQLKAQPKGVDESPSLIANRKHLMTALARGLELKSQLDLLRVKELQSRLSRLEQQIGRRNALSQQIIERRARELIEGDETRWTSEPIASSQEIAGNVPSLLSVNAAPPVNSNPVATESAATKSPKVASIQKTNTPNNSRNSGAATNRSAHPKKRPNELFAMNEDGTNLESLFVFDNHPAIGSPAISPDGKWIAFDETESNGASQIYVVNLTTRDPRRICSGLMPTWSSDSRYLVCTRREPNYGIWLIDTTNDSRTFLRHGNGAQFSPTDDTVAITVNQELSLFNIKTRKNVPIIGNGSSPFLHINSNGTWSPDGKSYCFMGQRSNGQREIATITMSGRNDVTNLKVHHSFYSNIFTDFAWHPNGQRIVFAAPCPTRRGLKQLYEFNPDKSDSVQLVAGQDESRNNLDMCWTPEGKRLLFISGDYCDD